MITEGFGLFNVEKYAEANKAFDEAIKAYDEASKLQKALGFKIIFAIAGFVIIVHLL
jgi:hypothetical protein